MKKLLIGLSALFISLCIILLIFPLPHGGTLGIALIREITDAIKDFPKKRNEITRRRSDNRTKREALYKELSSRFAGPLDFNETSDSDTWRAGTVLGAPAWLDIQTGLIWGSSQETVLNGWTHDHLQSAIEHCRSVPPGRYWSLPTNSEFALGIKNKMQNHLPDIAGKWIAQSISSNHPGLEAIPTVVGFSNQGVTSISVRCVARTEKAPLHGYIRDDISNADVLGMANR